jgi:uncharacterized protein YeaO (DUF488 family)
MKIQIKRVYEPPGDEDGFRVLVDRLWPRGLKKANAHVDIWAKELAPTPNLRKWFDHDESKFREFRVRYLKELGGKQDFARSMMERATGRTITLLFAARDLSCNHAVVLQQFLSQD